MRIADCGSESAINPQSAIRDPQSKDTDPDKRFTRRSQPEYVPARPLFSGVFTFPWYETSLRAWLWLSIGGFAVGVGLRGMVLFWPGG